MITRYAAGLTAAVALSLALAACGGGSGGTDAAGAAGTGAGIHVADTDLGDVLVDSRGLTVYLFEADADGTSACTGDCAAAWPPVMASAATVAGDGIDAAKLGTLTRDDGSSQVTYNGHPLYRFTGDGRPGDVNGEGSKAFGAEWYAVSADGDAVEEKQDGGGGYGGY